MGGSSGITPHSVRISRSRESAASCLLLWGQAMVTERIKPVEEECLMETGEKELEEELSVMVSFCGTGCDKRGSLSFSHKFLLQV